MSNLAKSLEGECKAISGCEALKRIIDPRGRDIGGFEVKRILPSRGMKSVGPWVFFDHMGPADFAKDEGIDVRPHPHIGLATVTYLFEGELQHKDSLGTDVTVKPGDINLMVAGHGIVHSERQPPEVKQQPHRAHGLQLWLALPEADEQCDPSFHHYDEAELPSADITGGNAKILIGEAYGKTSPVKTFSNTLYIEVNLAAGETFALPKAQELAVYVVKGSVQVNKAELAEHHMGVFGDTTGVALTTLADSHLVLVGGDAIGTRYMYWNFVASNKELLEAAKERWQQQAFPKIPGDAEDFVPLP
ncbi:hypothetical protein DFP83_1026 [Idiomarina fontislapidosi]|uniref:Pirin family protein n=1 Tax=Idiomarina fontislapidosi TaxID=263723 RepID=A0A432Y9X5_9GAMM|nr:pirin family protein [Idiomarina fontislapidosi]PYE34265.1 hypothetical protein DFP83_1026 [Idiomarina fontislapidosi]RUO57768.1 hypothetical protein CWE25_04690 [Idiomarina fontislapidosi]